MEFFDTHAHIHFADYSLNADEVWEASVKAGVTRMLAVGCDVDSSVRAVEFASKHDNVWAVVGVHPHEASSFLADALNEAKLRDLLNEQSKNKIVAIGEFGLDYYYEHSTKEDQLKLLKLHFQLAQETNLPIVLHIREAYNDFWPIFDQFNTSQSLKGVVHCFTGTRVDLSHALARNLYVALNGIMTFTKDEEQLLAAKEVPLEKLLLETDAPYLTPKPFRGKICRPEHIVLTAKFLSELRKEEIGLLARTTTGNACSLFNVK